MKRHKISRMGEVNKFFIFTAAILLVLMGTMFFIGVDKHCHERFFVWSRIDDNFGNMPVQTGEWVEIGELTFWDAYYKNPKYHNLFKSKKSCILQ